METGTRVDNYACEECGFHYRDKKTAERCAAWCRARKSCNLEIIKHAIENERPMIDG